MGIESSDEMANFIMSTTGMIGLFPAVGTESIQFESSQGNTFSQPVTLTINWLQDDPQKPQGIYSGRVGIDVMLIRQAPTGS